MISSLRLRFSVGFIGLALGPILLMGLLYGYIVYQDNVAVASYRQQELAHRIAIEAQVALRELQQSLRQTSEHRDFLSDDNLRREKLLNTLLVTSKQFTELAIIDKTGYTTLRLSMTSMVRDEMAALRDLDAVFSRVQATRQFTTGKVFFDELSGEPLITLAFPLIDLYSNDFQGVLLGIGRLKSLWELIQRNNGTPEEDIYLLDGQGRVVAHRNPSVVLRGSAFKMPSSGGVERGLGGTAMIIGSHAFTFGGRTFSVIAERSARIAMAPAFTALQLLFAVTLLALLVATGLTYLAIRHVIDPIHKLSTTVRAMRDGDLAQRVEVDRRDEIGELAEAFNSMSANLAESIHSLEESESLYRLLVENQNDLIVKFDPRGHLSFVSHTYCETFGKSRVELLGQSFLPLIHEEDRERVQASIQRLTQPPYTTSHEERALTSEGYCWFSWSARGVLDESGGLKEVISVGRDITERKRFEAEHHEIEVQLRQAQKMEAIGQLTGGIAHDFNNILASIIGYTTLAKQKYSAMPEMETLARYLDEIDKAGGRAKDLVKQMLSFSRGQAGELVPLALKPLVGEDIKMLRSIIPSSIDITVSCEPELPEILVDPIQLHQVIMNLCINARDAIGQKGEITLQLRRSEVDGMTCRACDRLLAGNFVELVVSDNGDGISEENLQRIFEPFFSTKAPGKGTGMGLHTVSVIMHGAGGHIMVESKPGEGTSFRLLFPVYAGGALAKSAVTESLPQVAEPGPQRGRILMVDDEATVANLMRELLGTSGYEVTIALSGPEALEQLSVQGGDFDLLITDNNMPGLSGIELAKRVTELYPALPIILNSGFMGDIDMVALEQSNIKEVMQKPIQLRELLKIVQQNINHKS